jgi:hypothetical protein
MTRNERAGELTKLLETESGLDELAETYRQVCHHEEMATPDLTPAMMIDQILEAEYPTTPVGGLSTN